MDFRNHHPSEEIIEQYLFSFLPESEIEALEEHLLVCHPCVDAAEKLMVFVESCGPHWNVAFQRYGQREKQDAVELQTGQ